MIITARLNPCCHTLKLRLPRRLPELGPVDVVINCAAISQPKACEADPELAERINVPSTLLTHLRSAAPDCLFIHLSTDQVYAGAKSFYEEDDETCPVSRNRSQCSWRDVSGGIVDLD